LQMCVTKLLLTSECRFGRSPLRSLVSGNTERSLYRVLRGAPRGVRRSVNRECAGPNAKSVKGSSPDNQVVPWWPSQYEEAKATPTDHRFHFRSVAYASSDRARPCHQIGTTGVQDLGMYTRPAMERERSARGRIQTFPGCRVGGQGIMHESMPTIPRAEVRCVHSSGEVE
jgi:hypothetical protein